jgi:hypothetical protein
LKGRVVAGLGFYWFYNAQALYQASRWLSFQAQAQAQVAQAQAQAPRAQASGFRASYQVSALGSSLWLSSGSGKKKIATGTSSNFLAFY